MTEKVYDILAKKCRVTVKADRETGWKLVVEDESCVSDLTEASKSMGVHARRFLKRRIETANPKVKEFIEKL